MDDIGNRHCSIPPGENDLLDEEEETAPRKGSAHGASSVFSKASTELFVGTVASNITNGGLSGSLSFSESVCSSLSSVDKHEEVSGYAIKNVIFLI